MAYDPAILRNNWEFSPAPSPQEVLQQNLAPLQNALAVGGQRRYETAQLFEQQRAAERLQSLRMAGAFKNITARDMMLLTRAKMEDESKQRVAAIQEKQRSDAALQQSLGDQIKQGRLLAAKYGATVPDWKAHADGSPPTPSEMVDYINKLNQANNTARAGKIDATSQNLVSLWKERDQLIGQVDKYGDSFNGPALKTAMSEHPFNDWLETLPSNSKEVINYNTAITSGTSPKDAAQASGLADQYGTYIQGLMPLYKAGEIQKQAPNDPTAKALLDQVKANSLQLDLVLQDGKGQQVDWAPEAQMAARSAYANTLRTAVQNVQRNVTQGGGDPNHPLVQDAAQAALKSINDKQALIRSNMSKIMGSTVGGQDVTPTVKSAALTKEDALANLGFHLDQNNQLQQATVSNNMLQPGIVPTMQANPAPSPQSLDMARRIIAAPNIAWKNPRPGLPGIQPGQPATAPVTPVAPVNAAAPATPLMNVAQPVISTPSPPVTNTNNAADILSYLPRINVPTAAPLNGNSSFDEQLQSLQSPYMAMMAQNALSGN